MPTAAVSTLLALVVSMPAPPRPAAAYSALAAGPYETYGAKVEEAEAAADAGSHADAIVAYRDAYEALPAQDRAGDFGADVVGRVGEITKSQEFVASPDPAALRAAIALTERHLEDIARFAPERNAEPTRASLAALLALADEGGAEPGTDPPPTSPADPVAEPEGDARPPPDPIAQPGGESSQPPAQRDRRPLGIGLVVGGALGLAGGAALLGYGAWRFNFTSRQFLLQLRALDDDESVPSSLLAWRSREYLKSRLAMGFGGALAGVGLGLLIGGAVVLAKNKKQRTAWLPAVGPGFTGVQVAGRF